MGCDPTEGSLGRFGKSRCPALTVFKARPTLIANGGYNNQIIVEKSLPSLSSFDMSRLISPALFELVAN